MSAESSPASASRPALTVESGRVATRRPGLGRWLGGLTVAQMLVPLLVGMLADGLVYLEGGSRFWHWIEIQAFTAAGYGLMFSPLTALLGALASSAALGRSGPAVVAAGRAGLRVARGRRQRWIPREEIAGGLVVPGWRPRVQLQLEGERVLEVDVLGEPMGARLLAALGIGPEERRVSVQLTSGNTQATAGCAALPASSLVWAAVIFNLSPPLQGLEGPLWIVAVSLSVLLLRRLARPTEVVVGSDGVRVQKPFSTRWLPYAELDFIWEREDRVILGKKDGKHVALRAPRELGEALAQRIREAQAISAAAGGEARGAAALERQGRPLAAWREGLRGLIKQAGGYRAAVLTAEDVMAVLESPEATRERRLGAALALKEAGHPEARARIRVAAETSADEDLRAALEMAAEDELYDAVVERALQER